MRASEQQLPQAQQRGHAGGVLARGEACFGKDVRRIVQHAGPAP